MKTLTTIGAPSLLPVNTINDLLKDWFVRDSETFTSITAEQKLAWEPTDNSAYSTVLYGKSPDVEYLTRSTYQIANSMLIAMNLPVKTTLFVGSDDSCTDGKGIWVSTKVFEDTRITFAERMDTFIGLTCHEAAHILYTDFIITPDKTKYSEWECKIIHQLANIIEDERIERLLGKHKPGTVRFLEKTKYYYFNLLREAHTDNGNLFNQCFSTFLEIIRYPRFLTEESLAKFGTRFLDIKEAVTPYPETPTQVLESSEKVFNIMKDLLTEEQKQQHKEESELQEAIEQKLKEALSKILKELKITSQSTSGEEAEIMVEQSSSLKNNTSSELVGRCYKGERGNTYFHEVTSNEVEYTNLKDDIMLYVSGVKKALQYHSKDYKPVHKSMRNGLLDTDKLVDAHMNIPTCYKIIGEVKTEKVAVCLLIDESGSMGNKKMKSATQTAILMYEALKDNKSIELFIYGHTADYTSYEERSTDIYVYNEKSSKNFKLGNTSSKGNNRDGVAIYEVAKRVRKQTQRPCLMFVISDGNPNASDYRDEQEGIYDCHKHVKIVEKLGFDVVQVAIDHSVEPSRMFTNYVIFEDLQRLPTQLNKMVKETILKKQKIHYS